jgi:hypothetical protein
VVKLRWVSGDHVAASARNFAETYRRYPSGYWYASTDDGGHDGAGPDPLTAVSNLVAQMEGEHP